MLYRTLLCSIGVTGAFLMICSGAGAAGKYPEWKGAWERWVPAVSIVSPSGLRTPGGQPSFDQTKPWGRGQGAPLTAEYQKVLDDSIADQASGGQGNNFDRARCLPTGMPHMMTFGPVEFVVTPDTTYLLIGTQARRFYTDGRDWPHPNVIHDEVTVIDHALTRPWTVDKRYVHSSNPHPDWRENSCVEGSGLVAIGREMYVLRGDGVLMPAKEGQHPPDLRYFKTGN